MDLNRKSCLKKIDLRLIVVFIMIGLSMLFYGCLSSGGDSSEWNEFINPVKVSNLKGRVVPPTNNNINSLRGSSTQAYFPLITTQGTTVFIEDDSSLRAEADADGYFVIPNVPEGKHRVVANIVSGTTSYRQISNIVNVNGQYETQEIPYDVELRPALYYAKLHLSDLVTSSSVQGKVTIWGFTYEAFNGMVEVGPFPEGATSQEILVTAIGYKDLRTSINFGDDFKSEIFVKMTPTTSIDANQAPIVGIQLKNPKDTIVRSTEQIELIGVGNDPDGDLLSYKWSSNLGSFINPNSPQTTYIAPAKTGMEIIKLTATDSKGATGQAVLNIAIEQIGNSEDNPQNQPPTTPSNPFPSNFAKDLNDSITLTWQCSDPENQKIIYHVYLGNNKNDLRIATSTTQAAYTLPYLETGMTYYWQIVAYDEYRAMSTSDIWQFSTKANNDSINNLPPFVANTPFPKNFAEDIGDSITLSWQCGDPENDAITYFVYYGENVNDLRIATTTTQTFYTLTNLLASTTYFWAIEAYDEYYAKSTSEVWQFNTISIKSNNKPPTQPNTPFPLNFAKNINNAVTLSWQCSDPENEKVTYYVYLGDYINYLNVATYTDQTAYTLTNLKYNTTYYWKIVAYDEHYSMSTSDIWQFTTKEDDSIKNMPPAAPKMISPTNLAKDVTEPLILTWQCGDTDNDPITYSVYLGKDSHDLKIASTTIQTAYTLTDLEAGTTYFWKIEASDGLVTNTSEIWQFTTKEDDGIVNMPPIVPNTPFPANFSLDIVEPISLAWQCSDLEGDAITYTVYFGNSKNDLRVATTTIQTAYTLTDLELETIYYWKVEASDGFATSSSEIWQFTTKTEVDNNLPYVPSNPVPENGAININEQNVAFSWMGGDPDNDSVNYRVYLATSSSAISSEITDFTLIKTISETSFNYTLSKGCSYKWLIIALDSKGAQTDGPVWEFSTISTDD